MSWNIIYLEAKPLSKTGKDEFNMSEMNFNDMMNMISNMDKKELETKMNQVSQMLNSKTPEEIVKEIKGNANHKNQMCFLEF